MATVTIQLLLCIISLIQSFPSSTSPLAAAAQISSSRHSVWSDIAHWYTIMVEKMVLSSKPLTHLFLYGFAYDWIIQAKSSTRLTAQKPNDGDCDVNIDISAMNSLRTSSSTGHSLHCGFRSSCMLSSLWCLVFVYIIHVKWMNMRRYSIRPMPAGMITFM